MVNKRYASEFMCFLVKLCSYWPGFLRTWKRCVLKTFLLNFLDNTQGFAEAPKEASKCV